ncbi:hypothetical protein Y032_0235g3184 [Ancylostoma ceylanicum]|uniref:Uncharacterized protein n=1 Tax=Ancylostoma ceylanicum TaxID=53326 RepID=A0A016SF00_9BILA|nr:hypothetical protein Y032_0235g3184 [Ancylostoma ceylanicum]
MVVKLDEKPRALNDNDFTTTKMATNTIYSGHVGRGCEEHLRPCSVKPMVMSSFVGLLWAARAFHLLQSTSFISDNMAVL